METISVLNENKTQSDIAFETVTKWGNYQKLIKEELILNEIINKHQQDSIELLKNNFYEYYKCKLTIKESCDYNSIILGISTNSCNKINTHVELEENSEKELLEVFEPLNKFLFQLRNNIQHVINIIENLKTNQEMDQVVDLLCHFFYENILITKPEQEEVLLICYHLLEKEIENLNSPSVSSFLNGSFIGKFLKSFTRRQDIKSYLSMVLGDLILKMEKSTVNFLEIDVSRINDHLRNKKTNEILNKSFNLEKVKKMFEMDKKLFLNDRIRKTTINKRKSQLKKTQSNDNIIIKLEEIAPKLAQLHKDKSKSSRRLINGSKSFSIDLSSENSYSTSNKYPIGNPNNDLLTLQRLLANKKKSAIFNSRDFAKQVESMNINMNSSRKSKMIINSFDSITPVDEESDEEEEYNTDYFIDLTEEQLKLKFENEENPEIKEYCLRQIRRIEDDKNIYTNQKFLDDISVYKQNSCKVLYIYKRNFEEIKLLIDQLFKNLIENNSIIPYVIKCICKIVEILITRKFPKIGFYDKNSFIGEFIFGKLIIIILTNPDYNGIISNTVISLNTRKNLVIVNKILKKIYRASFFDSVYEPNFTIFNTYLIEIMPMINNFFKTLTNVKLPKIIEDLLDKKVSNLKSLDYFSHNKEQLINLQSICFSIDDLFVLFKTVKNNLDLFSHDISLKKSLEKIEIQEEFLKKKILEYNDNNIKKYFLVHKVINNPEKEEILYPRQSRFTFSENDDEKNDEFILSRLKFCIKTILRNLNEINSTVYSHLSEADTTEKLFHALNKIIDLEDFTDNVTNDKIPLSWYSLYLTSNVSHLNNIYTKANPDMEADSIFHPESNLSKIYEELIEETRKEIESLNSKANLIITKYGMNLRCAEKINQILKKDVSKVKQIEKFVRIEKFIQNGKISVCLRSKNTGNMNTLNHKDDEHNTSNMILISKQEHCVFHKFSQSEKPIDSKPEKKNIINSSKDSFGSSSGSHLYSGNKNYLSTYHTLDKMEGHCETIEEFIHTFQLFNEIKEDIVFGDQRNKIYETLEFYLNIVKEQLMKDELFYNIYNNETIHDVLDEIENYLLKKMYKNTFPESELPKDIMFYEQCLKFSWITPVHLEISEKYINENLWRSAIEFIKQMDDEKSPVDKLKCVHSAYKILNNCISFCSGKQEYAGLDDIFPIFIYVILKSEPKRMFSNIQYIRTFKSPERLLTNYGFLLTQIETSVNFILEINEKMLKITPDEYYKNLDKYNFSRDRSNSIVVRKSVQLK